VVSACRFSHQQGENTEVGAAALNAGHSSEESDEDQQETPTKNTGRNQYAKCKNRWLTADILDTPVKVYVLKGHCMLVEYTGEAIISVCRLIADVRRRMEQAELADHSVMLDSIDEGKITYVVRKNAFQATADEGGKRKANKLFVVKRIGDGEETDAATVLRFARAYWNQIDVSKATRYATCSL
jgi:hypothetical protein